MRQIIAMLTGTMPEAHQRQLLEAQDLLEEMRYIDHEDAVTTAMGIQAPDSELADNMISIYTGAIKSILGLMGVRLTEEFNELQHLLAVLGPYTKITDLINDEIIDNVRDMDEENTELMFCKVLTMLTGTPEGDWYEIIGSVDAAVFRNLKSMATKEETHIELAEEHVKLRALLITATDYLGKGHAELPIYRYVIQHQTLPVSLEAGLELSIETDLHQEDLVKQLAFLYVAAGSDVDDVKDLVINRIERDEGFVREVSISFLNQLTEALKHEGESVPKASA